MNMGAVEDISPDHMGLIWSCADAAGEQSYAKWKHILLKN